MIDSKSGLKGWGAQVRVEASRDPEMLELMRRSGGDMVYVGLESINPDTLAAFNKQQSVEDVGECVRRFHEYGIRVHGMFVFGGEGDTVQTIRDTVDFALDSRIDSVQFLTLTPLPGTPLFQQLEAEGRLLTRQWDLYDGHHAVFQPAQMSPDQLQSETITAFKRFYAFRNIFKNVFVTGWETSFYRSVGCTWCAILKERAAGTPGFGAASGYGSETRASFFQAVKSPSGAVGRGEICFIADLSG